MEQLRGKRKLIAVLAGLAIYFVLNAMIIFFVLPIPSESAELNAYGILTGAMAGAISVIIGVFVGGNVLVHKKDGQSIGQ